MTALKTKPLRVVAVFVGGVLLNFLLLAFASQILLKQLEPGRYWSDAQHSAAAYNALPRTVRVKEMWVVFVAVPMIGCLIGMYAAFVQREKAPLLAVACLLPMFVYVAFTSEPVRTWPLRTDVLYFSMHAVVFLLAVVTAALVRGFLDKRESPPA
jgi:hypothetical protein